ncbi:MAG: DUF4349 domain-containing protein, partial [Candidatus Hydrogenedentota bacterium]
MSEIVCARAASLENAIWEGTLTAEQESDLRAHAGECETCRSLWEEIYVARNAVKALSIEEDEAPDIDAAWVVIKGRTMSSGSRSMLYAYGTIVGLVAVIVISVFVALGGPKRNMFSAAVGTGTEGQNQAALPDVADGLTSAARAKSVPAAAVAEQDQQTSPEPMNGGVSMNLRHAEFPGPEPTSLNAPRRVQRSALLDLAVESVRPAFKRVSGLVAEAGGIVTASNLAQSTHASPTTATLTVKIPVAKFDGRLRSLRALRSGIT